MFKQNHKDPAHKTAENKDYQTESSAIIDQIAQPDRCKQKSCLQQTIIRVEDYPIASLWAILGVTVYPSGAKLSGKKEE